LEYKIYQDDSRIVVENIRDFELKHIFECGQCFRWYEEEDRSYTGVAIDRVINIKKDRDTIVIDNASMDDFKGIWYEYLDLGRDYGNLKESLSSDEILKAARRAP
jgi:N-glycosylase/DNA lyase